MKNGVILLKQTIENLQYERAIELVMLGDMVGMQSRKGSYDLLLQDDENLIRANDSIAVADDNALYTLFKMEGIERSPMFDVAFPLHGDSTAFSYLGYIPRFLTTHEQKRNIL